jgi:3-isopropylmalate/(R)-2-methylmalate dehydratase small subunit
LEPFRVHTGVAVPLPRADVDTDQIIPKEFLKRVERTGYGDFLFWDWRFDGGGVPRAEFVLNRPEYRGASILVTRENFGCGSSREHAAWALQDFGFRAILAPSFADIFRQNADSNGIAALTLGDPEIEMLLERSVDEAPLTLTVDLARGSVARDDEVVARFELDDFRRRCLMEGLDRIGLTLRHEEDIAAYEARRFQDR